MPNLAVCEVNGPTVFPFRVRRMTSLSNENATPLCTEWRDFA